MKQEIEYHAINDVPLDRLKEHHVFIRATCNSCGYKRETTIYPQSPTPITGWFPFVCATCEFRVQQHSLHSSKEVTVTFYDPGF